MNRKEEIEARLAAIRKEMDAPDADIDALTEEVRGLKAELNQINEAAEKRRKLREAVSGGAGMMVRDFHPTNGEDKPFAVDSEEYRTAWLKHMQGRELNAAEQRAYTVANGAISQLVVNDIMTVVRDHAPLMERITMVYSASKITYYVEGTINPAQDHTENATITPDSDTLTPVELTLAPPSTPPVCRLCWLQSRAKTWLSCAIVRRCTLCFFRCRTTAKTTLSPLLAPTAAPASMATISLWMTTWRMVPCWLAT